MRKIPFVVGVTLCWAMLGLALPGHADVYVSNTGNDGNSGLASGSPKLTMAAAVGVLNTQGPGSVLHVLSSITENALVGITANGASGNPIVVTSDPAGTPFTLAGVVVQVTGTFVTVQNLNFDGQGTHEACVVISSVASDCTVSNCQFTGVAAGAELFVTEDVPTFIAVQGAANVSITSCTFNPAVQTDNMVVLSDMAGPASNFTYSNCTVNSNSLAGGIKAFRAWDNISILNSQFLDMRIYSFELASSASVINNGTSNNILVQDSVIRGYISTSSDPGAVRILSSKVFNLRVIRCAISNLGTGGVEGVTVWSNVGASSIDTFLVDGMTFQKDPTSTSAFQTPIAVRSTNGSTPPLMTWATNVTIQNCVLNAAVCVQFERAIGVNVTVRDCTLTSAGANAGTLLRMVQGSRLYNMLVERVTANNTLGDDCLAFNTVQNTAKPEAHGVIVRNCNFTSRTAAGTLSTNNEGISFKDGPYSNVEVHDTFVNADVGFNVSRAGAFVDGLVMDNCVILAGTPTSTNYLYGGFLVREDGTAPGGALRNATVTNTSLTGVTGLCLANSTSPHVNENISFTNCDIHGYSQSALLSADFDLHNLSFTDCTFDGPAYGFGAAVTAVGATLNARDLSWTNCQFTCTSAVNDTTTLRPAAFLWETANSRLTYATMTNCVFSGGNHAFSIARNNIPAGPGDEPLVNGLLVQDCTMQNAFTRGLNIAYADGGDLTFRRVVIQNVPVIGANLQFYGDNVLLEDVSVNGGGLAQGMLLSTKAGNVASGWRVRNGVLSNLAGGVTISGPVRNSTLEGVTITGQGIAMDNSAAGSAADAAQGIDVVACRCVTPAGIGIAVEGAGNRVLGCTVEDGASIGIAVRESNLLLPANQDVTVSNNTVSGCVGAAILLEGKNSTVASNTTYDNGAGVIVRSGNSGLLTSTSNTTGNLITRNGLFGGVPASATGISESVPSFFGDPGPSGNTYLNNTATDWAEGSEFSGANNTIQNNIFAFNTGSGLKILPAGLSGLVAGWNCAAMNGGVNFDGIAIDYAKDIWYDPDFVSRNPASPSFYLLSAASGCLDRGTPVSTGVDLGARESGTSEVASWRLY